MARAFVTRPRTPTEAEPRAPARPVPALLALQRTAGNRAVCELLARSGDGVAVAATPEQDFEQFVREGGWDLAAAAIVKVAAPAAALAPLEVGQLRLLQDPLVRRGEKFGPAAVAVLAEIDVAMRAKGVDPAKTGPGAAYGRVEIDPTPPVHGDVATDKPYEYRIRLRFLPDVAAVDADQIAFIQTARVVDTATGANRDGERGSVDRQTGSHTSIDRSPGSAQGWYSMKDDGTADASLTIWDRRKPETPAAMLDRPSGTVPNATWDFETAVVSLSGPDAGTVYATIVWGFTTDDALKVTPKPQLVTNKQSREFSRAVDAWNEQAADPARRQAPGQQQLPGLR